MIQSDFVPERFETPDSAAFDRPAIALIEVGGAEILIGGAAGGQMVVDDQDRMGHGDGRSLPATPSGQGASSTTKWRPKQAIWAGKVAASRFSCRS